MKNNIEFYQHYADSDQHAKFKLLRVSFGWAGEGRFWALNNRIAQAENCWLDISKKYNKASIASDLAFKNLEEFDAFIDCLKNDCELLVENGNGKITTDIVQENFKRVMGDRNKSRTRKTRTSVKSAEGSPELSLFSSDQNNKGKERKGKEREVDTKNGDRSPDTSTKNLKSKEMRAGLNWTSINGQIITYPMRGMVIKWVGGLDTAQRVFFRAQHSGASDIIGWIRDGLKDRKNDTTDVVEQYAFKACPQEYEGRAFSTWVKEVWDGKEFSKQPIIGAVVHKIIAGVTK